MSTRSTAAPADQLTVRRSNLSLVLTHLRDAGPRSRARVAADTGLNKATVSSLVAELIERGLVREGDVQRIGSVGRPGLMVELAASTVVGVGLEVNADFVDVTALDLTHGVVLSERTAADMRALGEQGGIGLLTDCLRSALDALVAAGCTVVGITVAVPALVDSRLGRIAIAPNLGWSDCPIGPLLTEATRGHPAFGAAAEVPVMVDNDANLGAIAEHAVGVGRDVDDLVYLAGEVGVGCGVVVDGELVRGATGFTGEIGHAPLNPRLDRCGCGRVGCWETQVGLGVLLTGCAHGPDDVLLDPETDIDGRLAVVRQRAAAEDERTCATLERVGIALGLGASVLVNIVNPRVLVLGGYFALLAPLLRGYVVDTLLERVVAPDGGGVDVRASTFGFAAASRGGAVVALQEVFADPTRVAGTTAG
ncbi:ROK family transcriptional regulator [Aquipuribacter sp. SD81]|uniref:ROK family transcriptional regulator n=1 Tax=Aquipuribacter sp. SD81 TaxID=3127703 RepID=UPI003019984C